MGLVYSPPLEGLEVGRRVNMSCKLSMGSSAREWHKNELSAPLAPRGRGGNMGTDRARTSPQRGRGAGGEGHFHNPVNFPP